MLFVNSNQVNMVFRSLGIEFIWRFTKSDKTSNLVINLMDKNPTRLFME